MKYNENSEYELELITSLKNRIIEGYIVQREDIDMIKNFRLETLCSAAGQIRDFFFKGKFDLCTIINGKSGKCSENCKFCAQSKHYNTGIDEYPLLPEEDILKSAKINYENGVNRFSIVTSGRSVNDEDVRKVCSAYRNISENCDIRLCSSHGLLNYSQMLMLKDAGVLRYHNNLETSRRFFPEVCTTHSYDEKIATIKAAKKAGLEVCSGGIFGLGETLDDRIDMAFTLRELEVDSVPVNILNPIKNTPFENNDILSYEEILRSIALYRFILPKTSIRLAGGRILMKDKGKKAIQAGVDAMISGEMLTTSGITTKEDKEMISSLSMSL